jgi:hypothetical protein
MPTTIPSKRALIDKSNSNIVAITAVAAFVIVFCLLSSKALVSQELYQGRVINKKKTALSQLKTDLSASKNLVSSYTTFINNTEHGVCDPASTPTNIICGDPVGTGAQDGDNAKIILDALPSQYDFPALATSLGDMITSVGLNITSITGTDDEIAQQATKPSGVPKPVPIPFQMVVEGNYAQAEALIVEFEHSIRPFQIQTIDLTGDQSDMTATISAQTYYQPGKTLSVTQETIK